MTVEIDGDFDGVIFAARNGHVAVRLNDEGRKREYVAFEVGNGDGVFHVGLVKHDGLTVNGDGHLAVSLVGVSKAVEDQRQTEQHGNAENDAEDSANSFHVRNLLGNNIFDRT